MSENKWLAVFYGFLIAIIIAMGVLVWSASAAQAHDTRPCVSRKEFFTSPFLHKDELAHRWEVDGKRRPGLSEGNYLVYPACGFGRNEAYVLVWFNKYDKATDMLRFVRDDATLHGNNRNQYRRAA